jgi:3-phenylpropionate/cinnamic acid dioxygenase small subunit
MDRHDERAGLDQRDARLTMGAEASMRVSDSVYLDVLHFLNTEAALLDEGRFDEWLELLDEDVRYQMPLTVTRERSDLPIYAADMEIMSESIHSLRLRIDRLKTEFAWAEDPPSRTRHLVTNVVVSKGATDAEVRAASSFCIHWSRGMDAEGDLFIGRREDTLVRSDDSWRLAVRQLYLDTATLGVNGVSILF